ncbi:MAG: hypothetical protein M1837_003200 [Sclerophora amabilis]|nr:MAG: hypothetical protein M1837_003200 [Sclerophora amabilis]
MSRLGCLRVAASASASAYVVGVVVTTAVPGRLLSCGGGVRGFYERIRPGKAYWLSFRASSSSSSSYPSLAVWRSRGRSRLELMMGKRKRSSSSSSINTAVGSRASSKMERTRNAPILPPGVSVPPALPKGRSARKKSSNAAPATNPDVNSEILDGPQALRASPEASDGLDVAESSKTAVGIGGGRLNGKELTNGAAEESDSPLSDLSDVPSSGEVGTKATPGKAKGKAKVNMKPTVNGTASKKAAPKVKKEPAEEEDEAMVDPEADGNEDEADAEEVHAAATRPPAVNSDYLPLPWKGRLGYACLCTYLRFSNPPVFSSRTCRMASIIEHRHPLKDPSLPEHATKNRPDREQPADLARGQAYVEALGLANARDIVKMIRWNDRYGIKFLRLSSEMFPFASHEEFGYKLAPFASEALADAGRAAAQLGHRLTTHPGQFTQLGSPRRDVIKAALRDLDYHAELLSLLKLPPQQDRDAIMVLHMGGVYGDKEATLDRFRENYRTLPQAVKNRLVLENDDVSWSVHDLLPICKELNIPMVLDYHHHNIIHSDEMREGTYDIMSLYDEIRQTWTRKGITQKMHYSEPTPPAITGRERRKHSPRVATLPPCRNDMDLMIEAKDKEQAVFELMRNFKLPGWDRIGNLIPHVRIDDNKPEKKAPAKKSKSKKKIAKKTKDEDEESAMVEPVAEVDELEEADQTSRQPIVEEDVGMGGPDGRVYWPPGMEEWLRPTKRVVKKKAPDVAVAALANGDAESGSAKLPGTAKKRKTNVTQGSDGKKDAAAQSAIATKPTTPKLKKGASVPSAKPQTANPKKEKLAPKKKKKVVASLSDEDDEDDRALSDPSDDLEGSMPDLHSDGAITPPPAPSQWGRKQKNGVVPADVQGRRKSGRAAVKLKKMDYNEADDDGSDI